VRPPTPGSARSALSAHARAYRARAGEEGERRATGRRAGVAGITGSSRLMFRHRRTSGRVWADHWFLILPAQVRVLLRSRMARSVTGTSGWRWLTIRLFVMTLRDCRLSHDAGIEEIVGTWAGWSSVFGTSNVAADVTRLKAVAAHAVAAGNWLQIHGDEAASRRCREPLHPRGLAARRVVGHLVLEKDRAAVLRSDHFVFW
jgi:hypothetical protein